MPELQTPQIKILSPIPRAANPPLVSLTDLKKDYYQFVVYGRGGTGKTDFGLRSTPKPIEWIDADHRANTIADKFNDGRIAHLFQPNSQEELENSVAHAIFNLQDAYAKSGIKGTIVLDSYTAAKNLVSLDYLVRQNRPVDSKMSIEDRTNIKRTMSRIINNLKYCQFNLVVTAEQGIKIIGEENSTKIAAIQGDVPKHEDDLMYFADYLLHLYPQEVKVENTIVTKYLWKLYKSSTSRIPQEISLKAKEDIDWASAINEIEGLHRAEIKRMRG